MSRYRNSHHGQRAMTGGDDQDEDKEKKRLDDGGDAQEPTMTSTTAARTQTQNATTCKGRPSCNAEAESTEERLALVGAGVSAAAPVSLPSVTLCRAFQDLARHKSLIHDKNVNIITREYIKIRSIMTNTA